MLKKVSGVVLAVVMGVSVLFVGSSASASSLQEKSKSVEIQAAPRTITEEGLIYHSADPYKFYTKSAYGTYYRGYLSQTSYNPVTGMATYGGTLYRQDIAYPVPFVNPTKPAEY